jgi:type I restriction enzyme S subunit
MDDRTRPVTLRLSQAAEVRLGRQRAPQYEQGDHLTPYLRSANVLDGSLDLADVKSMNFDPVEQSIFGLVPGDVLMTEGSGSAETVGTSAVWGAEIPGTVCFQNTLLRLRPRTGVTDGRFLAWWARHAHASGQIAAVTTGANIQHIGSDGLKDLRIHVPAVDEQRRIADFLDDRVARIDQIITARRRRLTLARDEFRSLLERELWDASERMPLKYLLANVTSGPRGWGDLVRDEGTPFVRIGNLRPLGIELLRENLDHVEMPTDAEAQRASLSEGDVLLSITAAFGQVAVWRGGTGTFSQHVARLRPAFRADSDWMAWVLQTLSTRDQYRLLAYGGTKIGMGLDQVRNLQVPRQDPKGRMHLGQRLQQSWESFAAQERALKRSVHLMEEYKQSLITAAVTGELDVTTAGSGIPG